MTELKDTGFVICLRNDGAEWLEVRKVYVVIPDEIAESHGYLRIIDDSDEDYIYRADHFAPVEVSEETAKELRSHRTPAG